MGKPSQIRLRDEKKLATTTYVNECARSINKIPLDLLGGPEFFRATPVAIGETVAKGPNGEAAPVNEAYWVQIQYVLGDSGDPADFADDTQDTDSGKGGIIIATNRAEIASSGVAGAGTHLLPNYTPVMVLALLDDAGATRYVFSLSPPLSFTARVGAATQDGTNFRWTYAFTEQEKTLPGYDGWTAKSGGRTGAAYNFAEEINGPSGLFGNGVNSANFPAGGTYAVQPIPPNRLVQITITPVVGAAVEYWFKDNNGVDGDCTGG